MTTRIVFDLPVPDDARLAGSTDGPAVSAVAGHFPHLPRTIAPLDVEPETPAGFRRCKVCGVEQPWREFRYSGGGNVAATCADCRRGR